MLLAFNDLITNKEANDTACEFIRNKIRAIVKDPQTAEDLCPFDHPVGTKRPCLDTGYYETYNRANVKLVNLRRTPIEEITPTGIRTSDEEFTFDSHRVRHRVRCHDRVALVAVDIEGRDGVTLKDKWHGHADLPRADGRLPEPVHHHRPWQPFGALQHDDLDRATRRLDRRVAWSIFAHNGRWRRSDVREAEWVDHNTEVGNATLYPLANSWYMGSNVPGKPRVLMPYIGGVGAYRERCDEIADKDYEGFTRS